MRQAGIAIAHAASEPAAEEIQAGVSRESVARTREDLEALKSRRLDVSLAVMMIDGIELKGRTNVVALGITTDGLKIPLGLWEGSTARSPVAIALVADLVERGLDAERSILFVIDGANALRRAIRAVFGERSPVQRCVRHTERNVLDHLPVRDRPAVKRRLRSAWADSDHAAAHDALRALAGELDRSHRGAALSLREGHGETLTLTRLGIGGNLKKSLESTNPCESMIEYVRRSAREVRRWESGDMALRWTAAGMLEAERRFHRIVGYADMATLGTAIERDLDRGPEPEVPRARDRRGRAARDRLTIALGAPSTWADYGTAFRISAPSAAIAALTAACVIAYGLDWQSPIRTILGVAFVVLGPGLAVTENLRLRGAAPSLAIAPATSLALGTLVGTTLIYAGVYTPALALYTLAIMTVGLVALSVVRRSRET